MAPIIEHPDVQRMLMTMKANVHAARGICHLTGVSLDLADHASTEDERTTAANRAALLTPIAKAFSTDIGDETTSIGVQVHGGMGFIEETGAAQHMRDSRIAAIYEGANGIHAIDLVQRKLPLAGGETVSDEIARPPVAGDVAQRRRRIRRDRGAARRGRRRSRRDDTPDAAMARERPELGLGGRVALSASVRAYAWRRMPCQSRSGRRVAGGERQERTRARRPRAVLCRESRGRRARAGARYRFGGAALEPYEAILAESA